MAFALSVDALSHLIGVAQPASKRIACENSNHSSLSRDFLQYCLRIERRNIRLVCKAPPVHPQYADTRVR
jgi:hypothetical protein